MLGISKLGEGKGGMYHPAAFDSAADSIRGVEIQGLGMSDSAREPIGVLMS